MSDFDTLERVGQFASTYFVVWILVFAAVALVVPSAFTWIALYHAVTGNYHARNGANSSTR